jgi:ubiquinone/menaquinone biosynthesis C-methylase UbiE
MSTTKGSIDWYNNNAGDYAAHVRDKNKSVYHHYYEKPAMYGQLPDLKNKTVLSMGCGTGEDAHYLKTAGAEKVYGIDISSELITLAQQSFPDCGFSVMDMESLTFSDQTFDLMYSSLAVHYIDDWTRLMSETYRVLKTRGTFLFSCNHPIQSVVVKDKERKEMIVGKSYFSKEPVIKSFNSEDTVINYNKTFEDIISYSRKAGFSIDTVVEPKPLPELESVDKDTFDVLNKIPFFIIVNLIKI